MKLIGLHKSNRRWNIWVVMYKSRQTQHFCLQGNVSITWREEQLFGGRRKYRKLKVNLKYCLEKEHFGRTRLAKIPKKQLSCWCQVDYTFLQCHKKPGGCERCLWLVWCFSQEPAQHWLWLGPVSAVIIINNNQDPWNGAGAALLFPVQERQGRQTF